MLNGPPLHGWLLCRKPWNELKTCNFNFIPDLCFWCVHLQYTLLNRWYGSGGSKPTPHPSLPASHCLLGGGGGARLYWFSCTHKLFCYDLYIYWSEYKIELDSCIPLFMIYHFQSIIYYTTRKSLFIMTSGLENSIMINRRRILHRFKLRQNAPLDNLFIFNFLSSSNFQNIISNCGRMHS